MSKQSNRTRKHIMNVFLELLDKNDFDKITVSQIASNAEINRGTFYLYFNDKYQLLEEIQNELLEGYQKHLKESLAAGLMSPEQLRSTSPAQKRAILKENGYRVLNFFYEHRQVAQILLRNSGGYYFTQKVEQFYIQFAGEKLKIMVPHYDELPKYELDFFFSGVISVIKNWLLGGAVETPEEMAEVFVNCLSNSPFHNLKLM